MSAVAGRGDLMIQVVPSTLRYYVPAANIILYPQPTQKREAPIISNASALLRAEQSNSWRLRK